jgi:hypothetical protein
VQLQRRTKHVTLRQLALYARMPFFYNFFLIGVHVRTYVYRFATPKGTYVFHVLLVKLREDFLNR